MDAIPSDESESPEEEESEFSFNRQESLLTVFEEFFFDPDLIEEVKTRPKNPNCPSSIRKKRPKKSKESEDEVELDAETHTKGKATQKSKTKAKNKDQDQGQEKQKVVEERSPPPMYENVDNDIFSKKGKWFPRIAEKKLMSEMGIEPEEEDTMQSFYDQLDDYFKSPDVIYKNIDRTKNKYISESVEINLTADEDYFQDKSVNYHSFVFKRNTNPATTYRSLKESLILSRIPEEEDTFDLSKNILDSLHQEDKKAKEILAKERNDLQVNLKDFTVRAHQGKIKPKGLIIDNRPKDFRNIEKPEKPEKPQDGLEFPSQDESTLNEEISFDKSERLNNPNDVTMFDEDDRFKRELKEFKILEFGKESAPPKGANTEEKEKPKDKDTQVTKPAPNFQSKSEKTKEQLLASKLNHDSFQASDEDSVPQEDTTLDMQARPEDSADESLFLGNKGFRGELKKYDIEAIGRRELDNGVRKFKPSNDDSVIREEPSINQKGGPKAAEDSIFNQGKDFRQHLKKFKVIGLKNNELERPSNEKPTVFVPDLSKSIAVDNQSEPSMREEASVAARDDSFLEEQARFKRDLRRFKVDSVEDQQAPKKPLFNYTPGPNRHKQERFVVLHHAESIREETSFDQTGDVNPQVDDTLEFEQRKFKDDLKKFGIVGKGEDKGPHVRVKELFVPPPVDLRDPEIKKSNSMTIEDMDSDMISEVMANNRSPNPQNTVASHEVTVDVVTPEQMVERHRQHGKLAEEELQYERDPYFDGLLSEADLKNKNKTPIQLALKQNNQNPFLNPNMKSPPQARKREEKKENFPRQDSEISNMDPRFELESRSINQSELSEGKSMGDSDMNDPELIGRHRGHLKKYGIKGQDDGQQPATKNEDIDDRDSRFDMPSVSLGSAVLLEEVSRLPSELNDSANHQPHREALRKFKVHGRPNNSRDNESAYVDSRLLKAHQPVGKSAVYSEELSLTENLNDSASVGVHRDMLRKFKVAPFQASSPTKAPAKEPQNMVANLLETSFDSKKEKTRALSRDIKKNITARNAHHSRPLSREGKPTTQALPNKSKDLTKAAPGKAESLNQTANSKMLAGQDLHVSNDSHPKTGVTSARAVVGNNRNPLTKQPQGATDNKEAKIVAPPPKKPEEQEEESDQSYYKPISVEANQSVHQHQEASFKMRAVRDSNIKEGNEARVLAPIVDFVDDLLEEKANLSGKSFDYDYAKRVPAKPIAPPQQPSAVQDQPPKNKLNPPPASMNHTIDQPPSFSKHQTGPKPKSKWELEEDAKNKVKEILKENKKMKGQPQEKKNQSFHSQFTDNYYGFTPMDVEQPSILMNSIDIGTVIPDRHRADHSMTQVKLLADLMGVSTKNLPTEHKQNDAGKGAPGKLQQPIKAKPSRSSIEDPITVENHAGQMPVKNKNQFNIINKPRIGQDDTDFVPIPAALHKENEAKQGHRAAANQPKTKAMPNIYVREYQEQQHAHPKDRQDKDHHYDDPLEPEDLKTVLLKKLGYKS